MTDTRPKSQGEKAFEILRDWKAAEDAIRAIKAPTEVEAYDAAYDRLDDVGRRRDELLRQGE